MIGMLDYKLTDLYLVELLTCKLTLTRPFESRNIIRHSCILWFQTSVSVEKE